mmetsp:Transcript_151500/g.262497  ORF Transcript_151500/g.262497 Transcript_151500/m.262497 type:complete len:137 (-) Transcript_151500:106-516(-)
MGSVSCCSDEHQAGKAGALPVVPDEDPLFTPRKMVPLVEDGHGGVVFEARITKHGESDRFGMDVQHVDGRLVVLRIDRGGAVERHNAAARGKHPPRETLNTGDVIVRVNAVDSDDDAMIAEIQRSSHIKLQVMRAR